MSAIHFPKIETALTKLLPIEFPIIMAPMLLVSNARMSISALKSGIAPCIPALNYRTDKDFRHAIAQIRAEAKGPIGINLIVNKSNIRYPEQLNTCIDLGIEFIITSLGTPEEVIRRCKPSGIKVFCDVTDHVYAKKVEDLGADALIAVNKEAGGHCGPYPASELIPKLLDTCKIPVISAGGVGTGGQMYSRLHRDGACGVSVGSIFIATEESEVSKEYKQACIDYGAKDIVLSTKISGSPCTVINTPYVQKIGTTQNGLERLLSKNKSLKKYVKMLTFMKGMRAIEKAAFSATYATVWCAGPTIEHVHSVEPVGDIVERLIREYYEAVGAGVGRS